MSRPELDDGLPPMDRQRRVATLRAAVAESELDALLVTKLVNLRWLTGFTGSAGYALVSPDRLVVITDGRYRDQVQTELSAAGVDAEIAIAGSPAMALSKAVSGFGRIGLEADDITWSAAMTATDTWFEDAEVVATRGLIERLRAVKEPAEVARIEAAAALADAALAEMTPTLVAGASEVEIAVGLESMMRRLGAEGPAFDTIVASGPNSAIPHHRPTTRRFESGDLVVIDHGRISTNDLKNGMTLDLDDDLFQRRRVPARQAGQGRCLRAHQAAQRPHRRRGRAHLPGRREGRAGHDRQARDAVPVPRRRRLRVHGQRDLRPAERPGDTLGDAANYLVESSTADLMMYGDEIVGVELPASVELDVAETEPGIQGDRVSGARKPATLETGLVVQVPLFVNPGDRIKVDTRTGDYITRA
jgi:hypothetical protein